MFFPPFLRRRVKSEKPQARFPAQVTVDSALLVSAPGLNVYVQIPTPPGLQVHSGGSNATHDKTPYKVLPVQELNPAPTTFLFDPEQRGDYLLQNL